MRWKRMTDPATGKYGHVCGDYTITRTTTGDKSDRTWKACRNGQVILYTDSLGKADQKCRELLESDVKALFFKTLSERGRMRDCEIMDFCDEMKYEYGSDVNVSPWQWYAEAVTNNTPCEGCYFIQFYPDGSPCGGCTRNRTHKDLYSKEKPSWWR